MEMKWLQLVSVASALLGNSMWLPPPTIWTASSATMELEIWLSISSFVSDMDEHTETCVWQYWQLMLQVNYAFTGPLQLKEKN